MSYVSEILADAPAGYWRLGEASGTSLTDLGSSATSAALKSGTLGISGAIADGDTAVRLGAAQIADDPDLRLGDVFTIEAWIAEPAIKKWQFFSLWEKGDGEPAIAITTDETGSYLRADIYNSGTILYSTGYLPDDNDWHHVVLTKDGADSHLYLDAVEVTELATNHTGTGSGESPVSVGEFEPPNDGPCSLDELAVYRTALSAARVAAHYAAASEASSTGPHPGSLSLLGVGR